MKFNRRPLNSEGIEILLVGYKTAFIEFRAEFNNSLEASERMLNL
jgi:hypothetical protein